VKEGKRCRRVAQKLEEDQKKKEKASPPVRRGRGELHSSGDVFREGKPKKALQEPRKKKDVHVRLRKKKDQGSEKSGLFRGEGAAPQPEKTAYHHKGSEERNVLKSRRERETPKGREERERIKRPIEQENVKKKGFSGGGRAGPSRCEKKRKSEDKEGDGLELRRVAVKGRLPLSFFKKQALRPGEEGEDRRSAGRGSMLSPL